MKLIIVLMGDKILRVFRNSKHTGAISVIALLTSLIVLGLTVADAYMSKTTVLAQALQSVGLCPLPDKTFAEADIFYAEPSRPQPSTSGSSDAPTLTLLPSPKPVNSSEPRTVSIRGAAGKAGTAGAAGIDGLPGIKGDTGEAGSSGSSGSSGAIGATGASGVAGAAGAAGEAGAAGAAGIQGPAGTCSHVDTQGPPGPQGEKGADGITGGIGDYLVVPVCLVSARTEEYAAKELFLDTCANLKIAGTELIMLQKKE